MKVNRYNITDFVVTTYADMFHRKAVIAYTSDGECYGYVTINIPQYSLDEEESFLSADCPNLIDAMVENGYLEITDEVKVNYGTYKIGKFTQKFIDEFEKAQQMDICFEKGEIDMGFTEMDEVRVRTYGGAIGTIERVIYEMVDSKETDNVYCYEMEINGKHGVIVYPDEIDE